MPKDKKRQPRGGTVPVVRQLMKPLAVSPQVLKAAHIFTTGQVAVICGVAPRTVSKWYDHGLFPTSYRIPRPGRNNVATKEGDRRITRDDLVKFMRENNLRIPPQLNPAYRVVVVGAAPSFVAVLKDVVNQIIPNADVLGFMFPGDALRETAAGFLEALVVDFSNGTFFAKETARMFTRCASRRIAVTWSEDAPNSSGFDYQTNTLFTDQVQLAAPVRKEIEQVAAACVKPITLT